MTKLGSVPNHKAIAKTNSTALSVRIIDRGADLKKLTFPLECDRYSKRDAGDAKGRAAAVDFARNGLHGNRKKKPIGRAKCEVGRTGPFVAILERYFQDADAIAVLRSDAEAKTSAIEKLAAALIQKIRNLVLLKVHDEESGNGKNRRGNGTVSPAPGELVGPVVRPSERGSHPCHEEDQDASALEELSHQP